MPGLHRRCEGGILASERSVDRSRHGDYSAGSREKSFEFPIRLMEAIVLVLVLLALFLGDVRAAQVSLILPLAALFPFLMMREFGLSANLMSLGGLA
jgi:multidrug efflux pump subunit AcrB